VVVHVERSRQGRRVACVGVVQDGPGGLAVVPALEDSGGRTSAGAGWESLSERLGLSSEPGAAA
jgi:pilus assembly protein CpaF